MSTECRLGQLNLPLVSKVFDFLKLWNILLHQGLQILLFQPIRQRGILGYLRNYIWVRHSPPFPIAN